VRALLAGSPARPRERVDRAVRDGTEARAPPRAGTDQALHEEKCCAFAAELREDIRRVAAIEALVKARIAEILE
jgi:hypothetical protein